MSSTQRQDATFKFSVETKGPTKKRMKEVREISGACHFDAFQLMRRDKQSVMDGEGVRDGMFAE